MQRSTVFRSVLARTTNLGDPIICARLHPVGALRSLRQARPTTAAIENENPAFFEL